MGVDSDGSRLGRGSGEGPGSAAAPARPQSASPSAGPEPRARLRAAGRGRVESASESDPSRHRAETGPAPGRQGHVALHRLSPFAALESGPRPAPRRAARRRAAQVLYVNSEADGGQYAVLELVRGDDLQRVLLSQGSCPRSRARPRPWTLHKLPPTPPTQSVLLSQRSRFRPRPRFRPYTLHKLPPRLPNPRPTATALEMKDPSPGPAPRPHRTGANLAPHAPPPAAARVAHRKARPGWRRGCRGGAGSSQRRKCRAADG